MESVLHNLSLNDKNIEQFIDFEALPIILQRCVLEKMIYVSFSMFEECSRISHILCENTPSLVFPHKIGPFSIRHNAHEILPCTIGDIGLSIDDKSGGMRFFPLSTFSRVLIFADELTARDFTDLFYDFFIRQVRLTIFRCTVPTKYSPLFNRLIQAMNPKVLTLDVNREAFENYLQNHFPYDTNEIWKVGLICDFIIPPETLLFVKAKNNLVFRKTALTPQDLAFHVEDMLHQRTSLISKRFYVENAINLKDAHDVFENQLNYGQGASGSLHYFGDRLWVTKGTKPVNFVEITCGRNYLGPWVDICL